MSATKCDKSFIEKTRDKLKEPKTRYKPTVERKTVRVMIRLTNKNAFYMSRLGYIDLRSGKSKNNASEFINTAITSLCESCSSNERAFAQGEELLQAWVKAQIGEKNAQMEDLRAEITALARKVADMRADKIEVNY